MATGALMEPVLTKNDLQSAVWLKLRDHLEAELAERRAYNDGLSLTDIETASIRGEIKRIKRLLRVETDAK